MPCSCALVLTLNLNIALLSGTLSSIPTALTRWTDECKVLDAESMHDCVTGMFTFELITNLKDMIALKQHNVCP